jgi:uncharacterized integral membrane protein
MVEYWNSLTALNKIKFIFSLIIGVIGVVFATLNWKEHEVHLLVKKTQMPLSLLILFSMAAGYAMSFVFSYRKFKAKDKVIENLQKKIEELEN